MLSAASNLALKTNTVRDFLREVYPERSGCAQDKLSLSSARRNYGSDRLLSNLVSAKRRGTFAWWICARLLCAATLWAQAPASSEQLRRARELVLAGKPEQAVPIYEELIRRFPKSPDLRLDLCIAQFKTRRYGESADQAKAALKIQPELPSANLFLGASYLELGEFTAAIPPLRKVLAAQPRDPNARLALAQALSGAKQYLEAAEQFHRLSELIPDNTKAWYGLGDCYDKLSEQAPGQRVHYQELAQEAFDRLMHLPLSPESCMHAAELREQNSEWVEAAKEWRNALELTPHDGRVRARLAWALFRARDYTPVLELIESMRKDRIDSAELDFLSGECWLNLEQPNKSITYLEKAIAADSHFLPAQAALGQALLRTGKAREAIPRLRAALSGDEDGTLHFQLYRAYSIAGQAEAAKQALNDYEEFKKRLPSASTGNGNANR
jgi:tetratricopeptide (TPR) repeat protein